MLLNQLLTPLGKRVGGVTSICATLLLATSPQSALSFSTASTTYHLTSPSLLDTVLQPTTFATLRRSQSISLYSIEKNGKKYDIDLTREDDGEPPPITESSSIASDKTSDLIQDFQSIIPLVGAQSLLIPISIGVANVLSIPNRGLGSGFALTTPAAIQGLQYTIPLFAIAGIMRLIEPYSKALQGVTKATQRSVLTIMGKKRRPIFCIVVSVLFGVIAGLGEEWLFRGVFQTALANKFASETIALFISGAIFGLLHAVTPLYALLATLASFFFGYLYNISGNLAVPMVSHAVYDIGALVWSHYQVSLETVC